MTDWNPTHYLAFERERAQPALDLIQRIPLSEPGKIVDLGCGPGNSTGLLRQRFPKADLYGIDSSPAMIERARSSGVAARFDVADAGGWLPDAETDLVFSNALFQWLPYHLDILRRLLASLRPGAVLAVQMPDNLAEPSHRAMATVAAQGLWRERLTGAHLARKALHSPATYHTCLAPLAETVSVWRTTYFHELAGHRAIADMFASTGLKPYLDALTADERAAFLEAYVAEITPQYEALGNGKVLFPFPRLFLLASRGDS